LLWGRLEQRIFVGKSKETKTQERKDGTAFGTQESNLSFPMEHCSFYAVSRESKTPLQSLVSDSFAEARGDDSNNSSDAWLSAAKSWWMSKCMGPTIVKRVW